MLFQACILALAVSSTLAVDCSNPNCKETWWDPVPRDLPSEICQAGKDWRNCLDAFLMIGCSFEDGFDVFYTQELNSADQYCTMQDPKGACDDMLDCTREEKIGCSTSHKERCGYVREWRSCLESLMSTCPVEFPFELNMHEAFSCYNSGPDAVSAEESCSGANVPQTEAPETEAPETEAPETEAPETEAPETEAPETEAPETEAPETEAPETEAPETEAPETEAPETEAPDTEAPETEAPETEAPQSEECEAALLDCETSYKALVETSADPTMACAMALGWNGCIDLTVQYGCPADVKAAEKESRSISYCGEEA